MKMNDYLLIILMIGNIGFGSYMIDYKQSLNIKIDYVHEEINRLHTLTKLSGRKINELRDELSTNVKEITKHAKMVFEHKGSIRQLGEFVGSHNDSIRKFNEELDHIDEVLKNHRDVIDDINLKGIFK